MRSSELPYRQYPALTASTAQIKVRKRSAWKRKRIKERRKALNLTREELSALVGYSAGFIQEVERGRSGLSSESMKSFSTALKVSTDSLIFGSNTDDASYISALLSSVPIHKRPHIIEVIEEAVECCK